MQSYHLRFIWGIKQIEGQLLIIISRLRKYFCTWFKIFLNFVFLGKWNRFVFQMLACSSTIIHISAIFLETWKISISNRCSHITIIYNIYQSYSSLISTVIQFWQYICLLFLLWVKWMVCNGLILWHILAIIKWLILIRSFLF